MTHAFYPPWNTQNANQVSHRFPSMVDAKYLAAPPSQLVVVSWVNQISMKLNGNSWFSTNKAVVSASYPRPSPIIRPSSCSILSSATHHWTMPFSSPAPPPTPTCPAQRLRFGVVHLGLLCLYGSRRSLQGGLGTGGGGG